MDHLEPTWSEPLADGSTAAIIITDKHHGDLAVGQDLRVVEARRRAVVDAPWTWMRQVHGNTVVRVDGPGAGAGSEADAACTAVLDAPVAVQVADCAPVAFVDDAGVVAVAHAGWRGLVADVLGETVRTMRSLGAVGPRAVLGPCISASNYEFGAADLDAVADRFGDSVRGVTGAGAPALDMRAGVRAALAKLGVPLVAELGGCTADDAALRWSHRARGEVGRQAMVVWRALPIGEGSSA